MASPPHRCLSPEATICDWSSTWSGQKSGSRQAMASPSGSPSRRVTAPRPSRRRCLTAPPNWAFPAPTTTLTPSTRRPPPSTPTMPRRSGTSSARSTLSSDVGVTRCRALPDPCDSGPTDSMSRSSGSAPSATPQAIRLNSISGGTRLAMPTSIRTRGPSTTASSVLRCRQERSGTRTRGREPCCARPLWPALPRRGAGTRIRRSGLCDRAAHPRLSG